MDIETLRVAAGVLGCSSVVALYYAVAIRQELHELRSRLSSAREHVASLQQSLHSSYCREEQLERQNSELNSIVDKVQKQRLKALERAAEANKARSDAKRQDKAKATEKTLCALQAAPLRPRDEVVASIRNSKAAQTISSAG